MNITQKIELTKKATAAATKWLKEEYTDEFLQQLEKHKLIVQAEGFLCISLAELQVVIEMAMLDGQTLLDIEEPFMEEETGPSCEAEDIGCRCNVSGIESDWIWDEGSQCYVCSGCGEVQ